MYSIKCKRVSCAPLIANSIDKFESLEVNSIHMCLGFGVVRVKTGKCPFTIFIKKRKGIIRVIHLKKSKYQ